MGNWHVRAGSEDEFVARWQGFITESAKAAQGFGSARLLRDSDDPRHFLSFLDWADAASPDAWKAWRSRRQALGASAARRSGADFLGWAVPSSVRRTLRPASEHAER